MEGATLKPNMVNPGRGCKVKFTAKEIGEATVTSLRRVMPAAMPGVNFLSGGQTLEDAAARLCAINQVRHRVVEFRVCICTCRRDARCINSSALHFAWLSPQIVNLCRALLVLCWGFVCARAKVLAERMDPREMFSFHALV